MIAAVVIGGTRLFGGEGSVIGALVGSLIMGMLTNGLILSGLSSSEQLIAQGVLLLLAISLTLREPRASSRDAMTTPLVRIERLRKEFGAVVALEEVTLDVNPGEIVALVGDNGAGKSTRREVHRRRLPADLGADPARGAAGPLLESARRAQPGDRGRSSRTSRSERRSRST